MMDHTAPGDLSGLYPDNLIQVVVQSFGYGHGPAPLADITIDTRRHLRNPHHDPAMRYLTGLDMAVRSHVMTTPGAAGIVRTLTTMTRGILDDHADARNMLVSVAIGCVGGRHRSVALAEELAVSLRAEGVGVEVEHRDITRPVLPSQRHTEDPAPGREFTHPDVLTVGVRDGWADPETDPARLDWPERQARAAIPFRVVDGRPVNPCERTGISRGRNELGHWGERQAADAIVTARHGGRRWVLMVERDDDHGWAVPGGMVDPGETPAAAAVRELAEETGLALPGAAWQVMPARYVPDPRASDEAWIVTTPAVVELGEVASLPAVAGADDARRAAWVRADSYGDLTAYLAETYAGEVFRAHREMLTQILGK